MLYIGIDGTRFDAIEKASTPNLDALLRDGIHSPTCLILGERYQKNDTISGPGWSSILTGVWADKHGVHNNTFKGRKYEEYPHHFARLKEVRPDAQTASFVTWKPIAEFITSAADITEQFRTGRPQRPRLREVRRRGYGRRGEAPDRGRPRRGVPVHRPGRCGRPRARLSPPVPEYVAAIERADKLVGEAVAAVKARKTYAEEDWLFVVTSDHGGKGEGSRRRARRARDSEQFL